MRIRGVKRGKIIELLEQINEILDGKEIIIDLNISATSIEQTKYSLTDSERLSRHVRIFITM